MPAFTYLGDTETVTAWGIEFPRGVAVDVTSPNAPLDHVLSKLRGNRFFSETFDGVELMPDEPKRRRKPKAE